MRKEAKKQKNVQIAAVQSYHGGNGSELASNYVYRGFTGNWYFNSDRKEKLITDENGNVIRENGQPLSGYGFEKEVECKGIKNQTVLAECCEKILFPLFKFGADMFKMQNDCSLHGDTNVEIITQVMTKSRIRNDYSAYKAMYQKYFKAFGITADSYQTSCGMHVNVSNAVFGKEIDQQIDNIRKLYYVLNEHYDFMCRLLYRNPDRTGYCERMTKENLRHNGLTYQQAEVWDYKNACNVDLYNAPTSHGNCFNMSHFKEGRVEIRLVGGQKDYYCFLNTMESIFFLCERMRTLKWSEVDDLAKIFKGCNQYVYKRIDTECSAFIDSLAKLKIKESVKEEDLDIEH